MMDAHDGIPVGILFSLTGTTGLTERGQYQSVLLAIKQVNEQQNGINGRKLIPIVEDIASDPFLAAKKAEKLIASDKVKALVGLYTSVCRKMVIPVLEKNNTLLFYPTQYEGEERHPNIIYCGPLPNQQLLYFIPWIIENLGKSFYLIGSDYIYPRETNRHIGYLIKRHGGYVVGESYAPLGTQKFNKHLIEIDQTNPEVVFSTLVGESVVSFYQQYQQAGFKSPITSSITAETEIQVMNPKYAVGHYSSFPYFNSVSLKSNQSFISEYRQSYGTDVISSAMENAYNSIFLLSEAMRKANSIDADSLRQSLSGLTYQAPQGTIRVDEKNRHLWLNSRIGRVNENGQFDIVWESDDAIAPVPFFDELFSDHSIADSSFETISQQELALRLDEYAALIEDIKKATDFLPFTFAFFDQDGYLLESFCDDQFERLYPACLAPGTSWSTPPLKQSGVGLALSGHTIVPVEGKEHELEDLHSFISIGFPLKGDKGSIKGVLGLFCKLEDMKNKPDDKTVSYISNLLKISVKTHEHIDQSKLFKRMLKDISDRIPESLFVAEGGEILFMNSSAQKLYLDKHNTVRTIFKDIQDDFQESETFLRKKIFDEQFEVRIIPFPPYRYIYINPIKSEAAYRHAQNRRQLYLSDIIGSNDRFLRTVHLAKSASEIDANVLILGESGTGKEVFARAIHNESRRKDKPFVALNCGALPRDLIYAELFGYVDGAFTGAKKGGSPGKFEAANSGTLFLDEIGDMPLELQVTLLRVLQEKEVTRVGSHVPIPVDVRIIAATNKNIKQEIAYKGSFRSDLYYRLNVFTIELLPLRERMDDIPELTAYFIDELNSSSSTHAKMLTEEAVQHLMKYSWPGNVRELKNVIERSYYLAANSKHISLEHLPEHIIYHSNNSFAEEYVPSDNMTEIKKVGEQNERILLIETLMKFKGNISKSARYLGVSRTTLYKKLEEHEIHASKSKLRK
ncbi:transporter substrate-binding protein [Ferviditalea candida]|uniref:Transporter substrate-binding protein n=1 Tax=Ferviditalea candida TaxID=3108399 RepID=A0ABU5ZLU9_9BACL|nr:transporter substrate-binding protein [Paenibacillaceae bacterium T2]